MRERGTTEKNNDHLLSEGRRDHEPVPQLLGEANVELALGRIEELARDGVQVGPGQGSAKQPEGPAVEVALES
eukprot:1738597-Pyramimonas_sp.AAC.1